MPQFGVQTGKEARMVSIGITHLTRKIIYYTSNDQLTHIMLYLAEKPVIAGTVLPDKLNKVITIGIQLQGEILNVLHSPSRKLHLRIIIKSILLPLL
ncbi:MAG TPA: hypothetical protein DCO83_11345 [Mucilaginibacter sp.]|nr:hypothetical protein [Mucilaginibacter sp.]